MADAVKATRANPSPTREDSSVREGNARENAILSTIYARKDTRVSVEEIAPDVLAAKHVIVRGPAINPHRRYPTRCFVEVRFDPHGGAILDLDGGPDGRCRMQRYRVEIPPRVLAQLVASLPDSTRTVVKRLVEEEIATRHADDLVTGGGAP